MWLGIKNKVLRNTLVGIWALILLVIYIPVVFAIMIPSTKSKVENKTEEDKKVEISKTPEELSKEKAEMDSKAKADEQKRAEEESEKQKQADSKIPGLAPVDVYLNFEKRGFKTTKSLKSEYSFWYSKDSSAGIDYDVTTYTTGDVNSVLRVSATAILNFEEEKNIIAVLPFIQYASSLPYDKAEPEKATQWVKDNFNNDKAETVIGGVKFRIFAPTEFARILKINKEGYDNL
jgi:hypothetical protein